MARGANSSYIVHSLRLCALPVASVLAGVLVLGAVPQGREVLRTIDDASLLSPLHSPDDFTRVLAFLGALALWSLACWYSTRILMQHALVVPAGTGPRLEALWRTWFPRALTLATGLPLAALLFGMGERWLAAIVAALASQLFLFVVKRRALMRMAGRRFGRMGQWATVPMQPPGRTDLIPEGEELMLWLAAALAVVVFWSLALSNLGVSRWLGGATVLLLSLAAIALFVSMVLVFWPRRHGFPALLGLVLVAALGFGLAGWTANHGIAARLVDAEATARAVRPTAAEHFDRWLRAADERATPPATCAGTPCVDAAPIVLVAAEGGASRSALWSAHVLGVLDQLSDGRFGDRVFAASGISGGSLGVATWVAARRPAAGPPGAPRSADGPATPGTAAPAGPPPPAACEPPRVREQPALVRQACFLGRDFIAPVLGYLLGVDLLQRVWPWPVPAWDRSRGLEDSWAQDWRVLFARDEFGRPLMDLYRRPAPEQGLRVDRPVLLLNSASALRGRPVLQSPLQLHDPEVDDLFAPGLRSAGLSLAGAVHNSARFPYVSPGGDVTTLDGRLQDTLVDGGYVENSGALALAALVRSLDACHLQRSALHCGAVAPDAARWAAQRQRLVVLFLANDPGEALTNGEQLCGSGAAGLAQAGGAGSAVALGELLTPPVGLFQARSSRADTARRALVNLLGLCEAGPRPEGLRSAFVSMASEPIRKARPVMSWFMTQATRDLMWRAVADEPARRELVALAARFGVEPAAAATALDALRGAPP